MGQSLGIGRKGSWGGGGGGGGGVGGGAERAHPFILLKVKLEIAIDPKGS